ncbi:MAG: hypothetical protein KFB93_07265 [Simkaniaceae bacterium]|nr:MAG: hypothetical protein KFB93_07265 [Simkaniaceae bacterium]
MSELSHPNDEVNEAPYINSNQESSFLHPIDEAEDFYDPFSDLNLFLSKKIKKEIQESGSSGKWSGKIEANLLAKILPEFKQKFPKYRLGTSALKKVWEKVAYYYEKIQGQKGALKENGALNLKFMIRENLKNSIAPYHLPPYTMAQQIATKLSECIASLEGEKPQLDHLTKVIWSVQKHLLKDLSAIQAKNPFEEYDKLDKLIVKTELEITAKGENLDPLSLKRQVLKKLKGFLGIKTLLKESQLTSTLSMILAEKLYQSSLVTCHFSLKEKQAIEAFIRHQIEMGQFNELLTSDEHRLELIQRILALYTIAGELPKDISEQSLRASILHVKELNSEENCSLSPNLDQGLFVFINAEIHLMDEEKCYEEGSENAIVKAYEKACALPKLSSSQMEQFELLIWKIIEEEGNLLSHTPPDIYRLLEVELGNVLIDNPKQSFRMIISNALQFFKKVIDTPMDQERLEDKVETWVAQNDMLIRTIHFDPKTSLLKLIEKGWKDQNLDEQTVNHEHFINEMEVKALETFPLLSSFQEELKSRLWILYKYLWYTTLSDGISSTYERFLLWHQILLKNRHPEWSKEKLNETLSRLSDQLIPLAPFESVS